MVQTDAHAPFWRVASLYFMAHKRAIIWEAAMQTQDVEVLTTETLAVSLRGVALLEHPLFNKGSAFTPEERREFGLLGLLPPHVATAEEQLTRTYENFLRIKTPLDRYIFLAGLQDRNETLFYWLLSQHVAEMMPIIYTPVVGVACEQFSHIYRRPRGLYIAHPDRADLDAILSHVPNADVRAIVVTDGERILGLGDQGIGGIGIPIGKLALYTLCAGIHPATTLPIILDVGTNNRHLLEDPLYLGWRHERVRGAEYDAFIEAFVRAVQRHFPNALLQWEDFAKNNASRLLERYRDQLCTFNDDIQGTGAVTLAGMLAAMHVKGEQLSAQRIVLHGAGSAAQGICDQIVSAMVSEGTTEVAARNMIWLVDSEGLVYNERTNLEAFKRRYAHTYAETDTWQLDTPNVIKLTDVVRNVHPTVLIGTSAQPGDFDEALVRDMAAHVERPIIFPLSNPTSKSEATPEQLVAWTEGRALIATGSPFANVTYGDRSIQIGQCNNVFIFPGVGLGVIATGVQRVTNEMFVAAAWALSELSPTRHDLNASLYPSAEDVRTVARRVAVAVAREAQRVGLAPQLTPDEIEARIDATMWAPHYPHLRPV
jgi:malate dehydrogenase (oxaloacetate-decarboxylating)